MFSLNRECAPLGYGSWQCMLDYHTSKSTRIINWRISGKIYIYMPLENIVPYSITHQKMSLKQDSS